MANFTSIGQILAGINMVSVQRLKNLLWKVSCDQLVCMRRQTPNGMAGFTGGYRPRSIFPCAHQIWPADAAHSTSRVEAVQLFGRVDEPNEQLPRVSETRVRPLETE